jgi:hypothetical protein
MASLSVKKIVFQGIALALPLSIVMYVLFKFINIFEKLIGPVANKLGVDKFLGEITLTFFAVLAILLIVFVLGLLMNIPIIAKLRKEVEEVLLHFIPSLNHLKLMAAEKLDMDIEATQWKPIFLFKDDQCIPSFLIEENAEWIIVAITKAPTTKPDDMMILRKNKIQYREITMEQMHDLNKAFGKGYLDLIRTMQKTQQ